MLLDRQQRKIEYLRISVTDKCNLRCRYCMPEEGVDLKTHQQLLRWEEIHRMVKAFADLGVNKVRITGGEPLVRKGLTDFIAGLAQLGLEEISITTNGLLLEEMAADLKQAGISRVNVSLDSLDPDRFRWITRGGDVTRVLGGMDAALAAGLVPLKVNTVVVRGFNDDEVVNLASLARDKAIHVRFIELMPVGLGSIWGPESFVSTAETMDKLKAIGDLQPAEVTGNGPAQVWRLPGFLGTVGFISAISQHFCARCNRIRLTADGRLYPCLHSDEYVDCFTPLRGGADDEALRQLVLQVVAAKPAKHELGSQERSMHTIGG